LIDDWINPIYLKEQTVRDIAESVVAKPSIKYVVLDNFFKESKLDELIAHHKLLKFSEENDRFDPRTKALLPYDGAVVFAQRDSFGADLFYDPEWQEYCCFLLGAEPKFLSTEIKLRYHRPDADGFWIHTDSTIRKLVAICYFNKDWVAADGGLLQLWRVDEAHDPNVVVVNTPTGRMDFLNKHQRIRTQTPGGGFPDDRPHDLVLVDQIVPTYNRLFLCNFRTDPSYHSVTPSNGKSRIGFVQWFA